MFIFGRMKLDRGVSMEGLNVLMPSTNSSTA